MTLEQCLYNDTRPHLDQHTVTHVTMNGPRTRLTDSETKTTILIKRERHAGLRAEHPRLYKSELSAINKAGEGNGAGSVKA